MSVEITKSFVEQYSANVMALVQQKGSKLRSLVRYEKVVGKAEYIDQIGAVAAKKKTTRHADTPQSNTPHSRRKLSIETYNWADLIDNDDKVRMLIDPTSDYANAAAWAMGRSMDEVLTDAALGIAYTGENGTDPVVLPPSQIIAPDNVGFTFDKLRNIKTIFDGNDVPAEDRFIILTAQQLEDLLGETKVTSSDYASAKALQSGELREFMGFKFIQVNGLRFDGTKIISSETDDDDNILRHCFAFQKDGLALGIGEDIIGKISERNDKCHATQVYFEMSIGAARMEEKRVVRIDCLEPKK